MLLPVRSVLKCRSEFGVCRTCYGPFLATGDIAEIGGAVCFFSVKPIPPTSTLFPYTTLFRSGWKHDPKVKDCTAHARRPPARRGPARSEEHTSELQSHVNIVCRLLLEKKKSHARCCCRFARC